MTDQNICTKKELSDLDADLSLVRHYKKWGMGEARSYDAAFKKALNKLNRTTESFFVAVREMHDLLEETENKSSPTRIEWTLEAQTKARILSETLAQKPVDITSFLPIWESCATYFKAQAGHLASLAIKATSKRERESLINRATAYKSKANEFDSLVKNPGYLVPLHGALKMLSAIPEGSDVPEDLVLLARVLSNTRESSEYLANNIAHPGSGTYFISLAVALAIPTSPGICPAPGAYEKPAADLAELVSRWFQFANALGEWRGPGSFSKLRSRARFYDGAALTTREGRPRQKYRDDVAETTVAVYGNAATGNRIVERAPDLTGDGGLLPVNKMNARCKELRGKRRKP